MASSRSHPKRKEKYLIIFGICMTICSIILLGLLLGRTLRNVYDQREEKNDELCFTKECVNAASSLLSSMDFSVDPCDDFYKFTCSGFIRKNPVPEGEYRKSNFLQYHHVFKLQQIDLIKNYNTSGKPDVMFRAQEAFHVCNNISHNKEKELAEMKKFIKTVLDDWPMVVGKNWSSKYDSLEEYFGTLMRYGLDLELMYISYSTITNKSEGNRYKIEFVPMTSALKVPELIFPSDGNGNSSDASQIKAYILFFRLLSLFGSYDNTTVLHDLQEMNEMHTEIMSIIKNSSSYSDKRPAPKKMTFKELTELTDKKFDWLKMMNTMFKGTYVFNEDDYLYVVEPENFKHLPSLLERYSRRSITNSIILSAFVHEKMIEASSILENIHNEFYEVVNAKFRFGGSETRQEKCLRWVKKYFPIVLTRMFADEYVNKDNVAAADEMVQLIEKSYREQISNSEWLDEETKREALIKGDMIRRFVGYPNFTFNDEELGKAYHYLSAVKSTYFENYFEIYSNYSIHQDVLLMNITKENMYKWPQSPLEINALYTPLTNAIWFPVGVLQLPLFDAYRSSSLNFGMMGSIIGHELGHAFDSTGRHYDRNGDKGDWWTNETTEIFLKKSECFVEQYNNYCLEDGKTCINGKKTLGENLADFTGLEASYKAYKMWVEENGEEKRLPGLEAFTPEQIFFISYGHIWCENLAPDKVAEIVMFDVHSPGKYRVIGTLSNSQHFQDAFQCKVGLMNRGSKKCTVW